MEITIKTVKLSQIKLNPDNPRRIGNIEMDRLVKSLRDFPEMMQMREIIVDETMTVLGGNMRTLALRKIGAKDATAKIVTGLTPQQKREFVIKDNIPAGEWDMDALANMWSELPLDEWGINTPKEWLENYSKNIEAPIYIPSGDKPEITALFDDARAEELIKEINDSGLPGPEKLFMVMAARRHVVFNYKRIAEYYAHSEVEMQKLMEDSALIIIDFNRAIELGYVKVAEKISEQFREDHEN